MLTAVVASALAEKQLSLHMDAVESLKPRKTLALMVRGKMKMIRINEEPSTAMRADSTLHPII